MGLTARGVAAVVKQVGRRAKDACDKEDPADGLEELEVEHYTDPIDTHVCLPSILRTASTACIRAAYRMLCISDSLGCYTVSIY